MHIDEYLERYERYRNGYNAMKKTVQYLEKNSIGQEFIFVNTSLLKKELEHRERVLRHATARMQAAISRIGDPSLANYIICKYFYDMKNSVIAQTFNYCERQIYRISSTAKPRLYKELVKLMPKPKRGETGKRYSLEKKNISYSA